MSFPFRDAADFADKIADNVAQNQNRLATVIVNLHQCGLPVSLTFVGPVLLCRALSCLVRDQIGLNGALVPPRGRPRRQAAGAAEAAEAIDILILVAAGSQCQCLQALLASPEVARLRRCGDSDARMVILCPVCPGSEDTFLLPSHSDALTLPGKADAGPICVSLDAEPEVLMQVLEMALAQRIAANAANAGGGRRTRAMSKPALRRTGNSAVVNRKRGSVSSSVSSSVSGSGKQSRSTPSALSPSPSTRPCGLSARENEVAALAAQALSNAQIAARLGIAVATVKWNLQRVFIKMQIERRSQLVRSEYFL